MEPSCADMTLRGRAHVLTVFAPPVWPLLTAAAALLTAWYWRGGAPVWETACAAGAGAVLSGGALFWSLRRRAVCEWHLENGLLRFTHGAVWRNELTFRTDRLLYAEICRRPVYTVFGAVRVKLYADVPGRAFFSVILSEAQGNALVERLACAAHTTEEAAAKKYICAGRYAALAGALTDRDTTALLCGAAFCGVSGWFSGGVPMLSLTAAALWMGALLCLTGRVLSEWKLTVCRTSQGWLITKGLWARSRMFLPQASVAGILESRSPLAMLCGASRMSFLCRGGRIVPCMRWYTGGSSDGAALRLLGCGGGSSACVQDAGMVRSRYLHGMVGALCVGVLAAASALQLRGEARMYFCAVLGLLLTGAAVHCAMAIASSGTFRVSVSPSALCVGGMAPLSARSLTLRRGMLSGIRVSRSLWDTMHGTCSVELVPKGGRQGVRCRCVPYDKAWSLIERCG